MVQLSVASALGARMNEYALVCSARKLVRNKLGDCFSSSCFYSHMSSAHLACVWTTTGINYVGIVANVIF